MAKTPENVYALMDQVWEAAIPIAKQEAIEIQKMIDAENGNFNLEAWDWWYYAEKLRKEKYDLDDEQLKPYFELSNVQNGMFEVANKLWGLTFEERFDLPKPHPDAHTFEVFDNDGSHQAILLMDFFPRPSKRGGAWMSSYRKQYTKEDEFITPVITMVMNFSKPSGDTPSLLTFEEVSTMFHEFGHALHGMLSVGCNKSSNNNDDNNENSVQTQVWDMLIHINFTYPDTSPFDITGIVDVKLDGNNVTLTGDYTIGALTYEDIVFTGTKSGNKVTMTTTDCEVTFESQGTTYTENISWIMDPFTANLDNASGGGDITALRNPGAVTESGTFTFTAELKED